MSEYVKAELQKALDTLKRTDPGSDTYAVLLRNIEYLAYNTEMFEAVKQYLTSEPEAPPAGIVTVFPSAQTGADIQEPYQDESPFPPGGEVAEETPAEAVDLRAVEDEPAKVYEMTEVRAALVEARKHGMNVTELLKQFGVDHFSEFPAGRYGELMEKLGAE